jgi:hypothetical protein
MKKTIATWLGSMCVLGLTQGCTLHSTSDADRFREPLPQSTDTALSVPGSQAAGSTTQSAAGVQTSLRPQGGAIGGGGTTTAAGYATYYVFTRDLADGVDGATRVVLGAVEWVASTPPTTIDASHAVWGPSRGDALDPVSWQLTVTGSPAAGYDYAVQGRPHLSTSDADWRTVLSGHGYDKASPKHRSGHFQVNRDELHALDPASNAEGGDVVVDYDARVYPATVAASVTTNDGSGSWFDVTVTHDQDGSGQVALTALGDVSTPKDGTNENVSEGSRWSATGAGRADVKISGGDLGGATVIASQCWSNAFAQTYYTDSASYLPTAGDPSTCAFAAALP